MRLITDAVIALVLLLILSVVLWQRHEHRQHLDRVTATQSAIRHIVSRSLYHAAMGKVEKDPNGFPMEVDPAWFEQEPSNALLIDGPHPWMDRASETERELFHPPIIVSDGRMPAFWYNPHRGVVRARVPMQFSERETVELYNLVNGTWLRTEDVDWTVAALHQAALRRREALASQPKGKHDLLRKAPQTQSQSDQSAPETVTVAESAGDGAAPAVKPPRSLSDLIRPRTAAPAEQLAAPAVASRERAEPKPAVRRPAERPEARATDRRPAAPAERRVASAPRPAPSERRVLPTPAPPPVERRVASTPRPIPPERRVASAPTPAPAERRVAPTSEPDRRSAPESERMEAAKPEPAAPERSASGGEPVVVVERPAEPAPAVEERSEPEAVARQPVAEAPHDDRGQAPVPASAGMTDREQAPVQAEPPAQVKASDERPAPPAEPSSVSSDAPTVAVLDAPKPSVEYEAPIPSVGGGESSSEPSEEPAEADGPETVSERGTRNSEAQPVRMDASEVTERDLIEGLGLWAELRGGRFPDAFTEEAVLSVAKRMRMEAIEDEGVKKDLQDALVRIMRGASYAAQRQSQGQWWYTGAGVELGNGKKSVAWYKPADADAWRVIYGDMRVKEAGPEDRLTP